ncbi:cytochrome c oxidase subunit II [Niallia sp. 03133]|uniref:cytochrome c oxidase subunit II n=1 Tax=Niallia sp. 03133 TaxID=3458060 RepID=UPI004044AF8C
MKLHKLEKIILFIGSLTLVLFLLVLAFQSMHSNHMHTSTATTVINPKKVDRTKPFNKPGLYKVSGRDWEYELVLVASSFQFTPSTIKVPEGAKIKIIATSKDVIHGFEVVGTTINLMLEPGLVSGYVTVFKKAGEFLVLCNEYCGNGHHFMSGTIQVVEYAK